MAGEIMKKQPVSGHSNDYSRLLETKRKMDPDNKYIGSSLAILLVFERIEQLNRSSDNPVLILGPTGTGKSEIASLIHASSARAKKPFRREQAAANKPQDMGIFLSKWAGVSEDAPLPNVSPRGAEGILHECAGGTIFIDEAADLSQDVQTFYLDVLDGEKIPPSAGSGKPITPDVRLIFATNRDLAQLVKDGGFRDDLYNRTKRFQIEIPRLNDRKVDITPFLHNGTSRDGMAMVPSLPARQALDHFGGSGTWKVLRRPGQKRRGYRAGWPFLTVLTAFAAKRSSCHARTTLTTR